MELGLLHYQCSFDMNGDSVGWISVPSGRSDSGEDDYVALGLQFELLKLIANALEMEWPLLA